ncbi:hypothetical protein D6D01_03641, partial [Aureobasidium pullulans]
MWPALRSHSTTPSPSSLKVSLQDIFPACISHTTTSLWSDRLRWRVIHRRPRKALLKKPWSRAKRLMCWQFLHRHAEQLLPWLPLEPTAFCCSYARSRSYDTTRRILRNLFSTGGRCLCLTQSSRYSRVCSLHAPRLAYPTTF